MKLSWAAMPFILAALSSTWAKAADADTAVIAAGQALVEANCARCHAVGRGDVGPHPDAPAFRELSRRYPIAALQEAFVEGIVTGHPDMPEFSVDPEQAAAIIAYLESIQDE